MQLPIQVCGGDLVDDRAFVVGVPSPATWYAILRSPLFAYIVDRSVTTPVVATAVLRDKASPIRACLRHAGQATC
jgi:hypothetical protein